MLENASIAPLTASHCHLARAIQRQHKRPPHAHSPLSTFHFPVLRLPKPTTAVLAWSITANCSTLHPNVRDWEWHIVQMPPKMGPLNHPLLTFLADWKMLPQSRTFVKSYMGLRLHNYWLFRVISLACKFVCVPWLNASAILLTARSHNKMATKAAQWYLRG